MTIVRCARCRIVVLDSNEDGEKEVQCVECGTKYKIKLEEGEVVSNTMLNQTTKRKEA
jgi:DNA-directed RNA polymerase subunit RPC12/RpoP